MSARFVAHCFAMSLWYLGGDSHINPNNHLDLIGNDLLFLWNPLKQVMSKNSKSCFKYSLEWTSLEPSTVSCVNHQSDAVSYVMLPPVLLSIQNLVKDVDAQSITFTTLLKWNQSTRSLQKKHSRVHRQQHLWNSKLTYYHSKVNSQQSCFEDFQIKKLHVKV